MSANMRAKMKLTKVEKFETSERWTFAAVCRPTGYSDTNGLDEDNTFAMYSPTADLTMICTNPALLGKFEPGETYYVDFTPA